MRAVLAAIVLTVLVVGYSLWTGQDRAGHMAGHDGQMAPLVEITVPGTLSPNAEIGKTLYDANCVVCHAPNAVGQDGLAPPLVHRIYEPGHHGDESFQRAVALGVPAHHWRFGDMPPVEGLTRDDVSNIVAYIRELQRANGIN